MGRRQATTELNAALSTSRLVTLTGPGGVGKTRLALHVARGLRRAFPDGVWLAELAKVQDPELVPEAVAASLEVLDLSARDPETVLVDYLAGKRLLLVLDNCEHLLESCSRLAHTLLEAAPGLHVLATSREPLGITPERVWPVRPLSLPADGEGMTSPLEYEALMLFQERAAAMVPGFTVDRGNEDVVARLCQRLDGIPLAIELAAVRMRAFSAEQILERLEDRFRLLTMGNRAAMPRHQSLRAAVEWSFDLCTPHERSLWTRCSVFAGEFDLDAAENVCADEELLPEEVFTAVSGLVDKSVLARVERERRVRYRMLETIREYGQERLAGSGEGDALRGRYRAYYLQLAEQADADSGGARQAAIGAQLRNESANFWAALDQCCTTPGEERTALRMAGALWFYWCAIGSVHDGRHWLDRVLALGAEPSPERARALWINGWIAHLQGDVDTSLTLLTRSREMAERLDDQATLTFAVHFLGNTQMWAGNVSRAVPLLDEALARHRAAGRWTAPALLIFALRAQTAGLLGDVDHAMRLLEECRDLSRSQGESWALAWTEWNVGISWWAAGKPEEALEHARQSLRKKYELGDQVAVPCCLELLSWIASAQGNPRRAAVLFGGVRKLWEPIGRPLFGSQTLLDWHEQSKDRSRAALGSTAFHGAVEEGARMPLEELVAYALEDRRPAAAPPPQGAQDGVLTKREREVAELVAQGLSNKDIAAKLVIAQRTVEGHVDHIFRKLGFTSRTQVALWIAQRQEPSRKGLGTGT